MSQPTVSTKPLTHMTRSHYVRLKALLVVTLICVVCLATATVILAISNGAATSRSPSLSTPPVTGSDYRGDRYTTGGQALSHRGPTGLGAAQCPFHYHKC
jgi:hypothetical protein